MDTDPEDDRSAVWAFVGVLVAFKLVGLAIILWVMVKVGALDGATYFLILYHLPWLAAILVPAFWPARALFRRLRARARRRQLVYAEWHVDEPVSSRPPAS